MKKNIIALISATVISLSAFLGGCSCAGAEQLSFNFSREIEPETLTYTVEYSENYIESYKKDPSVNIDFEYANGTYVTKCQKVVDRKDIESDIKDLLNDKNIYLLTTDFSIELTFNKEHHTETISTVAYVADAGMSLAPLYAKEIAEYVIFSAAENGAQAAIVKTESETFYNQENYTKVKKYKTFKFGDEINFDDAEQNTYSGKYTLRSVIDNAELYFALRGLTSIEEKSAKNVAVVSPAFNNPETLKITNNGASGETFTVKYNGETITENIKYTQLAFQLNKQNASGKTQYVSIQTEKTEKLPNFNIPLKFAKPLFLYGGFNSIGCLVFTVSEIER